MISSFSPTTSSAGLVVSTDAGLKSSIKKPEQNIYLINNKELKTIIDKNNHVEKRGNILMYLL